MALCVGGGKAMKVYILMAQTYAGGWSFAGAYATRRQAEDNRSWTWLDWSIGEAEVVS